MNRKNLFTILLSLVIIGVIFLHLKSIDPPKDPRDTVKGQKREQLSESVNKLSSNRFKRGIKGSSGSLTLDDLLKDVPCKEGYLILDYLSALVDNPDKIKYSLKIIAAALTREGKLDLALQIANSMPGKYNSVHCTIIAELIKLVSLIEL